MTFENTKERGFYWIRVAGALTIGQFNPGGIGAYSQPPTEWLVMGFDLPVTSDMIVIGQLITPPDRFAA